MTSSCLKNEQTGFTILPSENSQPRKEDDFSFWTVRLAKFKALVCGHSAKTEPLGPGAAVRDLHLQKKPPSSEGVAQAPTEGHPFCSSSLQPCCGVGGASRSGTGFKISPLTLHPWRQLH